MLSAEDFAERVLSLSRTEMVCLLDSCGTNHLGSRYAIAGIRPREVVEIYDGDPQTCLEETERILTGDHPCIFTLSYDFGRKIQGIESKHPVAVERREPDLFAAVFDAVIIFDQETDTISHSGDPEAAAEIIDILSNTQTATSHINESEDVVFRSNVTENEHIAAIEVIKEYIRSGYTYQTNFTRQLTATIPLLVDRADIFRRLRASHPAPFAAFIQRPTSTVISASPERFFSLDLSSGRITTSPIKGTRPRGNDPESDYRLMTELIASKKDRAENTMIVDLLRNDLGRVCEFGSVEVESLCEVETHPSYFDLVSTISGRLKYDATVSKVLRSLFPCGSITGAPKISTMRIIDEIERERRGLSMGSIGYYLPPKAASPGRIDTNVAIRTLVLYGENGVFNVGGGIVIDSDPPSEYAETVTKSKAILEACDSL
jgi:para-aminobenzoate synthetase component I